MVLHHVLGCVQAQINSRFNSQIVPTILIFTALSRMANVTYRGMRKQEQDFTLLANILLNKLNVYFQKPLKVMFANDECEHCFAKAVPENPCVHKPQEQLGQEYKVPLTASSCKHNQQL